MNNKGQLSTPQRAALIYDKTKIRKYNTEGMVEMTKLNKITDMDPTIAEHIDYAFEKFLRSGTLPAGTKTITAQDLTNYVEQLTAYANEDQRTLNQIAREMGDIQGYRQTLTPIAEAQVLFYLSCYTSWDLL